MTPTTNAAATLALAAPNPAPACPAAAQVDPSPPVPAMRLAVIVSLMALGSVATVDCAGRALRWGQRARQRQRHGLPILAPNSKVRQAEQRLVSNSSSKGAGGSACGKSQQAGLDQQQTAADGKQAAVVAAAPSCCRISADGSRPPCQCPAAEAATQAGEADAVPPAALDGMPAAHAGSSSDEEAAAPAGQQAAAGAAPSTTGGAAALHPARRSLALAQQQAASFLRQGSLRDPLPGGEPPPRPELALARGLSRRVRDLEHGRPRLVRLAALSVITSSFSAAYCCQIVAPGFVDPSLGEQAAAWSSALSAGFGHGLAAAGELRRRRPTPGVCLTGRLPTPACSAIDQHVYSAWSGAGTEPAAAPPPAALHLALLRCHAGRRRHGALRDLMHMAVQRCCAFQRCCAHALVALR